MKVWIIECDTEPLSGVTYFTDDEIGYKAASKFLNHLRTDTRHYYDAVLYERAQHTGMMGED